MPLKITLKPNEKIYINGAVIKNTDTITNIAIENKDVSILRQKNIMKKKDAKTYCEHVYYIIQLMYIDRTNLNKYTDEYWSLIRVLIKTVPTLIGIIDNINDLIIDKKYYQALKETSKLISIEKEYIKNV
jgi:flagellar biosynthesis repressor protein FlbT